MFSLDQLYNTLLVISIIIPACLAFVVLRQRPNLGARSFSVLMALVALWAFVSIFIAYPQDVATKVFSFKIKFLFVVFVPVAWLVFSFYYSNRIRRLPFKHLVLLLIVPMTTLCMVATNASHHWMFSRFEISNFASFRLISPYFGPYFWFHTAYSYILILIGFIVLAKSLIASPAQYRRQIVSLLIGGLAPWISNILFTFKIGNLPNFDYTPIAFSISGVAFMWGILRYRLLAIVPIARDLVVQNMNDGVIVIDNDENIIDLNTKARRLSGLDPFNVIGAHAEDIIPWWPKLKRFEVQTKAPTLPVLELELDGLRQWFQICRSPLVANSRSMGQMITLHDVTATHMAEMALRDSEDRFKSLSENAPVIIFSLDEGGIINYANPAWAKILGYKREDVLGKPFVDFVGNDTDHNVAEIFNQLIDGRMAVAELNLQVIHRNGSNRLFNTSAAANSDVDGRVTGVIGLAKDVTEERRLQQQLFQSQKMEAVGTLAGGIAHDFNNLLMGMQANLSMLHLETGGSESIDGKVMRIEDQIDSGASLTRQLLGYARKGKYTVTDVNLNDLIENTLNVVQRTNKGIEIQSRLADKSVFIRADRGQIELVLLNLFINAVDAMPDGGELKVSTRIIRNGDIPSQWSLSQEGPYVRMEVIDTGIGMDRATQDRIFEPFFTTKEIGRGTGLGLASVYGIVQNHKGQIQVHSNQGEGATFTLMLPAVRKSRPKGTIQHMVETRPVTGRNFLLVDDEPLILKYCSEMIKSLGFTVRATQDPREAIELFKQHVSEIDLVVLDLVMPKMDGLQLFHVLEEINPQIRAIIATGFGADDRIAPFIASGRHGCLRKPYGREELSRAISTLLSPRGLTSVESNAGDTSHHQQT